jgi:hypothetical protein
MADLIEQLRTRLSRLKACYTCQYYHRTRMAHEWTSGTIAYCVLITGETDVEYLVHMLHVCPNWTEAKDDGDLPPEAVPGIMLVRPRLWRLA